MIASAVAGAIGGFFNALVQNRVINFGRVFKDEQGRRLWEPGAIGNILIGGLSGLIALYLLNPSLNTAGLQANFIFNSLIVGLGGSSFITRIIERPINQLADRGVERIINMSTSRIDEFEQALELLTEHEPKKTDDQ